MKTRYSDMYDSYIASPSNSAVIENFKEIIASGEKYNNWADFEMGMASQAYRFSSEEDFIACIRDFKRHMVSHLLEESQKIGDIFHTTAHEKIQSIMM